MNVGSTSNIGRCEHFDFGEVEVVRDGGHGGPYQRGSPVTTFLLPRLPLSATVGDLKYVVLELL